MYRTGKQPCRATNPPLQSLPDAFPPYQGAPSHPWVSTNTRSRLQTLEEGGRGWSTLCRDLVPIAAPAAQLPARAGTGRDRPETHSPSPPESHLGSSSREEMGVSQKARKLCFALRSFGCGCDSSGNWQAPALLGGDASDFLWERGREQNDCSDANPNCCSLLGILFAARRPLIVRLF